MVSPLASRIGHRRRPRKRSYAERPTATRPAATSSSSRNAFCWRCLSSASPSRGAKPMPNCSAATPSKPRSVRKVRADLGLGGQQLSGVELLGEPVGLDQPGAGRPAGSVLGRLAVVLLAAQLHAVLVGEALDRVGEGQPVVLHHERDDVAAFLAAEAVEESTTGGHVERRGLLVVEGTQALQRAAAGVAEGDVRRHDVVDLGLLAHLGDVVLADASCHVSESTGRCGQGGRRSGGRSYPEGW